MKYNLMIYIYLTKYKNIIIKKYNEMNKNKYYISFII